MWEKLWHQRAWSLNPSLTLGKWLQLSEPWLPCCPNREDKKLSPGVVGRIEQDDEPLTGTEQCSPIPSPPHLPCHLLSQNADPAIPTAETYTTDGEKKNQH